MPDTPASSSRIVPDVGQSLDSRHLRQPPRPRLWPLWLCILILVVALAALAAGAWLERERLLGELEKVSGEVSNMHARLDSGDTDVQDKLTLVQAQVSTLFQEQEQLAMNMNRTREELLSLVPASEDMVSAEAIESLLARVREQQQAASLRDDRLAALGASLKALEDAADSEHDRLSEATAHLDTTLSEALDAQQKAHRERLAAMQESLDALAADVADMEPKIETLDGLQTRLGVLESELRQVRQSQLAFSAQLEMLR